MKGKQDKNDYVNKGKKNSTVFSSETIITEEISRPDS